MVGEMLRAGAITEEQARSHPYRNVITQAVGTEERLSPVVTRILKTPGDIWLLCSDGLTDMARDEEIAAVLADCPPAAAAEELVHLALQHGGTVDSTHRWSAERYAAMLGKAWGLGQNDMLLLEVKA